MKKKNNLEHKSSFHGYKQGKKEIDSLIKSLDQKHYLERKVKFLLDIRGYLKTNKLKGNYIEFGSYRSETHYAAYKILNESTFIDKFIGLDTFVGEPPNKKIDNNLKLFDKIGDFNCGFEDVNNFVKENMGANGVLIKGDFRDKNTLKELLPYKQIAVAVIDCNLLSSIESALSYTLKNIVDGGIIYFDDYFYNLSIMKNLQSLLNKRNIKFVDHNFYPPFAKSFLVTKNGK